MSSNVFDPTPDNGHRSTAVGQTDHQQLMTKANLRSIHDQPHFADPLQLRLQPGLGNRFVPAAHIDRLVRQKTAQTPHRTHILRWTHDFASDPTEVHRMTMIDPDHQPDKVLNLGDPLLRPQFTNSRFPSTIGRVDRHSVLLAKWFVAKQLYPISLADQYSFVKVSGS